jgi:hypothetical protein
VTLSDALEAFWISKLGADRVKQLPGGDGSATTMERARGVMRVIGKDRAQFHKLLFEGFDGYFHQSVFARVLKKSIAKELEELPTGKKVNDVELWTTMTPARGSVRVLAGVRKQMQFLTEKDQVVREMITIPVIAETIPSYFRVRVLTVQSTVKTWTELLGKEINRILSPIVDTDLAENVFRVVEASGANLGEMHDLSKHAVDLMKNTQTVFTYSGTFGVRKVGRTRHSTEGGFLSRGRQPLHRVMKPEFDELVSSDQIRHCDIEIQDGYEGLVPGTALSLYPVEGKLVFRKMLGGGLVNDFLAYLAR